VATTYAVNCSNVAFVSSVGGHATLDQTVLAIHRRSQHGAYLIVESESSVLDLGMKMPTDAELHDGLTGAERLRESIGLGARGSLTDDVGKLVIVTDPGQDPDDEMTLILARALADMGLVQVVAVVANLSPSDARARLARGTLDTLQMRDVPVGVGSDGNAPGRAEHFTSTIKALGPKHQYLRRDAEHADGAALLKATFEAAAPASITLLLISSLTDASRFIRDNEALFAAKCERVAIMGGVAVESFDAGAKALLPDQTAQNHKFDEPAAAFVFEKAQALKVPLVVLARAAAYGASVPSFVYVGMRCCCCCWCWCWCCCCCCCCYR